MRYTKPVLSIASSVQRLKDKGLSITDVPSAERFIRAVGYFRFRGYGLSFMQPAPAGFPHGTRQFRPGTTFADIQSVYEFDRSLRILVLEQIDRVEVAVRTAILQELNSSLGPHWYLDFSRQIFKDRSEQARWFSEAARAVGRSNQQFIRHYVSNYTSPILPPSWAVAECLSLGKWSTLYQQLRHGKSAIAGVFGLTPPILESWLHSINVLRNACAHHARIWNRSMAFEPKAHPHFPAYFAAPAKFYARATVIRILTEVIDSNPYLADGLRYLFFLHPEINPTVMGFPPGWEKEDLWR